ncbi:S-adenosyl-L-methionine-dependent methyltransferase [Aspergillus uvarum CBS 121591]|uniref:S-adenosyl-L-methionine-dependent methyltransferase n=1 Tax=Aspergillus uvarum CBS 121591 TaxID=1448315 RepID=A0A319BZ19_9EURO|nr:S-adenosyl-L-methionine-dependent methyltransferase [Aspergillus uvarum CBS 121591]PYH76819.1 S-adenosyl-L-methionine-dependent methyltransferase [Aspergillus uvarum CBS 121591]
MSSSTPLDAPPHILQLLSTLHKKSLDQEAAISQKEKGKVVSSDILDNLADSQTTTPNPQDEFDRLMLDKFIALDADKCQFVYQLLTAMGATTVIEAGTSFGVSTIYLALAVGKTAARTGTPGTVIATEKEPSKAAIARGYWAQCGPEVERVIDLREGDLLVTLLEGVPEVVDVLLLDIWCALALPTLKTVLPRLRRGAAVLTDNTISAVEGYRELLAFLRDPGNGFRNVTLPFTGGFEMSVYSP